MLDVRFPAAQGRPGTSGSYQRGDAVTIREGWPSEAEFQCKAVEKKIPPRRRINHDQTKAEKQISRHGKNCPHPGGHKFWGLDRA
jgi:hypothetical protein